MSRCRFDSERRGRMSVSSLQENLLGLIALGFPLVFSKEPHRASFASAPDVILISRYRLSTNLYPVIGPTKPERQRVLRARRLALFGGFL